MAVQPLSPATDRCFGGPLPRQLANRTRAHLKAPEFWYQKHVIPIHYAVLAVVSNCCPPPRGRLLTRYSPVRRFPLSHSPEGSFKSFSLDLHVLGTPPAFVLSQDQTLNKNIRKPFGLILLSFVLTKFASYSCLLLVRYYLVCTWFVL